MKRYRPSKEKGGKKGKGTARWKVHYLFNTSKPRETHDAGVKHFRMKKKKKEKENCRNRHSILSILLTKKADHSLLDYLGEKKRNEETGKNKKRTAIFGSFCSFGSWNFPPM